MLGKEALTAKNSESLNSFVPPMVSLNPVSANKLYCIWNIYTKKAVGLSTNRFV
jgi:hypothetical protein